MQPLSTDGLYITRRRKKWKFAHFNSYENCFEFERGGNVDSIRKQLRGFFADLERSLSGQRPVVIELAAGNAQFSLELARRHPEQSFIAIDIKADRLYTSAKLSLEAHIKNIAFLRMPITEVAQVFEPGSIDELWLTFPDPFPKECSAKHRLSHVSFLQQYCKILNETGTLRFKTDNRPLFLWSLEQFVAEKWQFDELSFDLHGSSLPEEYKIKTSYEERFTAQGIPTNYLSTRPVHIA